MDQATGGDRQPFSERQRLARALAAAGIGSGEPVSVPTNYAIEALARRWGVAPWEIENAPDADWVVRGLYYLKVEAKSQHAAMKAARSKKRG